MNKLLCMLFTYLHQVLRCGVFVYIKLYYMFIILTRASIGLSQCCDHYCTASTRPIIDTNIFMSVNT